MPVGKLAQTQEIMIITGDKGTKYQAQKQKLFSYFREITTSRYCAAIDTGIPLQNVCRYVHELRKNNAIEVIKHDKCPITGNIVEYLTTDQAKSLLANN